MNLPNDVKAIISRLNVAGHRADVVGGPVRDYLIGKCPWDYDLTTDATPDRVKEVFAGERVVETGIAHGTISLILNGVQYEITTYRIDGEYLDARHPESVSFTEKLSEDLRRRDFTMNAICYNPTDGFTDLHGGKEDIENKIIRAVGEPGKRFSEDALRILRALRFSAVLGFEIEANTARAALEKKELLRMVSAERIYVEWKKLLSGEHAYSVLSRDGEIIEVFLPELKATELPDEQRFSASGYLSRMLSLFHLACQNDSAKIYDSAMRRLKTDKTVRELGKAALLAVGEYDLTSERGITLSLMERGADVTRELIRLEWLLGRLQSSTEPLLDFLLLSGVSFRISDLAIGGADIMALGLSGKKVGKTLSHLLRLVVLGDIKNEREALVAAAKRLENDDAATENH